jgi:hypothetical protein
MFKPPTTLPSAGILGLERSLVLAENTAREGEGRDLRREVPREINSTTNRLQDWEADGLKSGVVGNLDSSSNRGQVGDCDVGQLWVGDECQTSGTSCYVTNSSQVGCRNAGEVVLIEDEGAIHGCQGWDANTRDVSECHVIGPDQVGEADIQASSIGSNVDTLGDVGNLRAEGPETVVVVDVQ